MQPKCSHGDITHWITIAQLLPLVSLLLSLPAIPHQAGKTSELQSIKFMRKALFIWMHTDVLSFSEIVGYWVCVFKWVFQFDRLKHCRGWPIDKRSIFASELILRNKNSYGPQCYSMSRAIYRRKYLICGLQLLISHHWRNDSYDDVQQHHKSCLYEVLWSFPNISPQSW